MLYLGLLVIFGLPYFMTPTASITTSTADGSGRVYRFKRIIGGYPVNKGTYPWAVSVQAQRHRGLSAIFRQNHQHYCGAALIAPNWVITAAHCLYGTDDNDNLISYLHPRMWHVRLASDKLRPSVTERVKGVFNRVFNSVFGYVKLQPYYHVQQIFHHPKYVHGHLEYDIALFQLKEEPVLRRINNLALIQLPDPHVELNWPAAGQTCTAVGWGCSFADGPPTMKSQAIELPVLSPQVCQKMYSAYINLTASHEFCAGYYNGNKGICPGDSGGPLVCQAEDGQLKLAGIVSATHSKQPADYPAVFTRVSYFTEWIEAVMRKHPPKMPDNPLSILHIKN
ncbi:hypothetical protein P879_04705 [Paragonimus westermani]|uniref:Peptidase S1 domain-containing protein n=1 Tax=Paragonimus westermani TaxID=34504 RepID=A0A8T0CYN2_9TREM|nr:hypothetical protein P879_04705 [Paragonimus westermani]